MIDADDLQRDPEVNQRLVNAVVYQIDHCPSYDTNLRVIDVIFHYGIVSLYATPTTFPPSFCMSIPTSLVLH